jgi:hypothetical protein
MTDLEENSWSECCCQKCGGELREEPRFRSEAGKRYCSRYCSDQADRELVSTPVFVAPPLMDLPAHLLRSRR